MSTDLELAALPPAAKLCLETANRCHGLIKVDAGYIGRVSHPRDAGSAYTALVVAQLLQRGLVCVSPSDDSRVDLTDAAIALVNGVTGASA